MTIYIHVLDSNKANELKGKLLSDGPIKATESAGLFVFDVDLETFERAAYRCRNLLLWFGLQYANDYTMTL